MPAVSRISREEEDWFEAVQKHLAARDMPAFVDMAVSSIARVEGISYYEAVEEYLGYFESAFFYREN